MISVIVPVYNVDKYLHRCVDSIINQTYKDLEIILIDDGSTDNSGSICDEYKSKDDRVIVIHKTNGGLSDARNKGLDNARGEYIGFVDSDDCIHPRMYEILINALIEEKADISSCEISSFTNEKDIIIDDIDTISRNIVERNDVKGLIASIETEDIVVWNKIYKRKIFENLYFEKGRLHEDMWIKPYIMLKANRIVKNRIALYYYYMREDSISKKSMTLKKAVDIIEGLKNTCDLLKRENLFIIQKEMARHAINTSINIYGELNSQNNKWTKQDKHQYMRVYNELLKDNSNVISIRQINSLLFRICPYIGYKVYKYRSR